MTAIFRPEGRLFRATELAGGPWSPDMLQGSATTALMMREVERLANASGFAVRRLTFDLWRPARESMGSKYAKRAVGRKHPVMSRLFRHDGMRGSGMREVVHLRKSRRACPGGHIP
jgi:hypothetical protein